MNNPDDDDDARLARRARDTFDAACADLDPAAANRLRLARRAALAAPRAAHWRLAPVAGAIALGLAGLWAWPRVQAPPATVPVARAPAASTAPQVAANAIDDAPAADEPDWDTLDADDADLYAWLAEAPVAADPGGNAL